MKPVPALTVLCLLAALAVPEECTAQTPPTITVSGEALVQVVPDKVTIVFGIETWDKDIHIAKQQNTEIHERAVAAIRRVGVRERDIQTDHLSLEPRYESEYSHYNLIGYFVRNSLSVVLTDPARIEQLITDALVAGVTHIHGINFETTEFKQNREEARRLALEAALEKARKMAAVLGKEVGDPVQVTEDRHFSGWSYYGGWWGFGRGQGMSQNVVQNVGGQSDDVYDTVALGKMSIRASVTVVFRLAGDE